MKTLQTPIQDEVVARAKATATAINSDRRLWLTATTVFGGTGLVASAVTFVASLAPSEKARTMGAPVELECNIHAPTNLTVPSYPFAFDSKLLIGVDTQT